MSNSSTTVGRIGFPISDVVSQKSEWSDLPKDLLELIFLRIRYVADLIRIGAVCSNWHTVIKTLRSHNHLCPILLLFDEEKYSRFYDIFDFSKNKIQRAQIYPPGREVRSGCFFHTCNGWLVRRDYSRVSLSVHLVNPFTGVWIQLPLNSTLHKVVLSSTTPLDPKCVFVANYEARTNQYNRDLGLKLCFCGARDSAWKMLKSDEDETKDYFVDIIYFKGQFYALGRSKELFRCDIDGRDGPPKVVRVSEPMTEREADLEALLGPAPRLRWSLKLEYMSELEWVNLNSPGRNSRSYLVDWFGDLLMVVRYTVFSEYNLCRTKTFKVYKFDFGRGRWEEIDTLRCGGGGGCILISFSAEVLSIKEEEDLHPFKLNCIYFLDDNRGKRLNNMRDTGVFCLSTKVCKSCRVLAGIWPPPFLWITPDLCTASQF